MLCLFKVLGMSPVNLVIEHVRMCWSTRATERQKMLLSCVSMVKEVILDNWLSLNSLLVFTRLENFLWVRCQMLSFPDSFQEQTGFGFRGYQQAQLSSSSYYMCVQERSCVWALNSRIKLIFGEITAPWCKDLIIPWQPCQQFSFCKQALPKLTWVRYSWTTGKLLPCLF